MLLTFTRALAQAEPMRIPAYFPWVALGLLGAGGLGWLIAAVLGFPRARGLDSVVGEYDVRARAAYARQRLQHHALLVDPAALGGGLYHRVLAGDVVGGERQIKPFAHHLDDVEVCDRGLDHEEVRALHHVQLGLAHRLARVGRVHLVRAPVAERGRAVRRLAERPVEGRRVLHGIGHDGHVLEPGLVQPLAYRCDLPVHHRRRRDDVGSRLRLTDSRARDEFKRLVVQDLALAHDAAVAVRGVLAQARVCDDDHFWRCSPHGAYGLLHDAARGVRARRSLVLRFGQAEEYDGGNAHVEGGGGPARHLVNPEVEDARQRRHLAPHALDRAREQRQYQILSRQSRLSHECAHALAPPQTPRSVNKITHRRNSLSTQRGRRPK